jgi:hypothetical protein
MSKGATLSHEPRLHDKVGYYSRDSFFKLIYTKEQSSNMLYSFSC